MGGMNRAGGGWWENLTCGGSCHWTGCVNVCEKQNRREHQTAGVRWFGERKSRKCFAGEVTEDGEKKRRKSDGEMAELMIWEWKGQRRCREMKEKGFQGRGKAVRQSAGLVGNGDEERKQTDNPD